MQMTVLKGLKVFEEIMKSSDYILDHSGLSKNKKLYPPKRASELQLRASTVLEVSSIFFFVGLIED